MLGNLGGPEIIFILAIALLIFGPKRLPEIGRMVGKGMAEFRRASNELKRTLNAELEVDEGALEAQRQAAARSLPGALKPAPFIAPRGPFGAPGAEPPPRVDAPGGEALTEGLEPPILVRPRAAAETLADDGGVSPVSASGMAAAPSPPVASSPPVLGELPWTEGERADASGEAATAIPVPAEGPAPI